MEKRSELEQLKGMTVVVCDSGDFEEMKAYEPRDATTNPTLIYKAVQKAEYRPIFDKIIQDNRNSALGGDALLKHIVDELLVAFGEEILKIVPGRVSTEVDARLSFDVEASKAKAREFIKRYESKGIGRERILIKLASTWEGAMAAKELQKEGINCNMTLMFALPQAVLCAEVGARLISPFVGRIYDWYKKSTGKDYTGEDDPGVESVRKIFNYYKKFGHTTEVMGASFRYKGQILALAGCDLLTISPDLLKELQAGTSVVEQKLAADKAKTETIEKLVMDEKRFRYLMNEEAMATEKLAEGIRVFAADTIKLEKQIQEAL